MATTFPLSTYELDGNETTFLDGLNVERDIMDDGTPRVRVMGADVFRTINCVFPGLSETSVATFEAYIATNRATEFDMVINGNTYRGYIWSAVRTGVSDGILHKRSFDFYGKAI